MNVSGRSLTLFLLFLSHFGLCQDFEYDKKIGSKNAEIITQLIGIYNDSIKTGFCRSIGTRLTKNLGRPHFEYQFQILDHEEPNAFSLPGGYVYVTRGMFPLLNNEDDLACVIAHEIIHSQNRHAIKQMKRGILPGILQIPGNIASGILGENFGRFINSPINFSSDLLMASYGRKNEKEADQLGMELAAKSGYEADKLAAILSRINKRTELVTGKNEKKNYLQGHPYSADRIAYIDRTAQKLNKAEILPVIPENEFPDQLEGIIIGQNPKQGFVNANKFIHPDLNIYFLFPENWSVINTPMATGAIEPNREAYLIMKANLEEKSPSDAAKEFYEKIKDENLDIINNMPLNINGYKSFLINLKTIDQETEVYYQSVWIQKDSILYNIVGYGYDKHVNVIQSSTESFRQVRESEIENLEYSILKIAEAKEGESLKNLLERFNSDENLELIAIMNDLDVDSVLKESQKIKIIQKLKYVD